MSDIDDALATIRRIVLEELKQGARLDAVELAAPGPELSQAPIAVVIKAIELSSSAFPDDWPFRGTTRVRELLGSSRARVVVQNH